MTSLLSLLIFSGIFNTNTEERYRVALTIDSISVIETGLNSNWIFCNNFSGHPTLLKKIETDIAGQCIGTTADGYPIFEKITSTSPALHSLSLVNALQRRRINNGAEFQILNNMTLVSRSVELEDGNSPLSAIKTERLIIPDRAVAFDYDGKDKVIVVTQRKSMVYEIKESYFSGERIDSSLHNAVLTSKSFGAAILVKVAMINANELLLLWRRTPLSDQADPHVAYSIELLNMNTHELSLVYAIKSGKNLDLMHGLNPSMFPFRNGDGIGLVTGSRLTLLLRCDLSGQKCLP